MHHTKRPALVFEVFDRDGNKVEDPWIPPTLVRIQPPQPEPPKEVWRICSICAINGGALGKEITLFFNKAFDKRHQHEAAVIPNE